MWLYEVLELMDKSPNGYSFKYDTSQRCWVAKYENPTFRTTVEGDNLEAVIKELYGNAHYRNNNGLVTRLPKVGT